MKPQRIQRSRSKGWKMPPNTVSVCRPGFWGNPYKVGGLDHITGDIIETPAHAVRLYRERCMSPLMRSVARNVLRGKNLACWCPIISQDKYCPCHADVLLSIANDTTIEEVIRENIRWAKGQAIIDEGQRRHGAVAAGPFDP